MSYLLVSRDPRNGIEARISVPTQALARRAGVRELDDGRDLVAVHATSGEWPVTVEEIRMSCTVRAGWRRLQGRDGTARPRREIAPPIRIVSASSSSDLLAP